MATERSSGVRIDMGSVVTIAVTTTVFVVGGVLGGLILLEERLENIRFGLHLDVQRIDSEHERRINDLSARLSDDMGHVTRVVERTAGQAHTHNSQSHPSPPTDF